MALRTKIEGLLSAFGLSQVATGSVRGVWQTMQADATSAATGLDIGALTDASHGWVDVPPGTTRLVLAARLTAAHTGTTTSPVVRVWGAWAGFDGLAPDDGAEILRIDSTDADGAGFTITIDPDESTVSSDGTYEYHNPTTWDGYDLRGASAVFVQVITAAAITGGAADIRGMFLN